MNLQQEVCLLMGKPRPRLKPRSLLLYLILCALAIVLLLLHEETA